MPTFQITSPDGKTFEITAPDGASQDEVLAYARKNFNKNPPEPASPFTGRQQASAPTIPQRAGDAAVGLAQGITLNFADEIGGGVKSLFTGEPYAQARQEFQNRYNVAQQRSPLLTGASEIAGSLAGGVGGGLSMAYKAPRLAQALSQGGRLARLSKAAGMGSIFGAASGAGASQNMQDVPVNALSGGILGAIGGGVGQTAAEGIEKVARQIVPNSNLVRQNNASGANRYLSLFSPPSAIDEARRLTKINSGLPVSEIPLTAGQRTQNFEKQAFEQAGRRGAYGQRTREVISNFDSTQQAAIRNNLRSIAPVKSVDEQGNAVAIVEGLQNEAAKMKAAINQAYTAAKQSGNQAFITKNNVNDYLVSSLNEHFKSNFVPLQDPALSFTSHAYNKLQSITQPRPNKLGITDEVDINALENWRRNVSQTARTIKNDPNKATDYKFLVDMRNQYDNFMDNVLENSLLSGDEKSINLYRNAINLRARYAKRFERSQTINDLVFNGDITPESAVNLIYGSAALSGKKQAGQVVKDLYEAAGSSKDKVREHLQDGLIQRLFTRGTDKQLLLGGQDGAMQEAISPKKLNTEMSNLISQNKSLFEQVFDPQQQEAFKNLHKQIKLIASEQPGTVNHSNTFYALAQFANRVPVFGKLAASQILNSAGDIKTSQQMLDAVRQVLKPEANKLSSAIVSGNAAAGGNAGQQTSVPDVTITQGNAVPVEALAKQYGLPLDKGAK